METLINIIAAMLTITFGATFNEHLVFSILFFGFIFAMLVAVVSALRQFIQFIINKTRK